MHSASGNTEWTCSRLLSDEIISRYFEVLTQQHSGLQPLLFFLGGGALECYKYAELVCYIVGASHLYGPSSHISVLLNILSCHRKGSCKARGERVEVRVISGGQTSLHTPLCLILAGFSIATAETQKFCNPTHLYFKFFKEWGSCIDYRLTGWYIWKRSFTVSFTLKEA